MPKSQRGRSKKDQPAMRFNMKFAKTNPRDVALHAKIAQDTETGEVNVSGVLKDLAWEWYQLREVLGYIPPPRLVVRAMYGLPTDAEPLRLLEDPTSLGRVKSGSQSAPELEQVDLTDPLVSKLNALSFEEL